MDETERLKKELSKLEAIAEDIRKDPLGVDQMALQGILLSIKECRAKLSSLGTNI